MTRCCGDSPSPTLIDGDLLRILVRGKWRIGIIRLTSHRSARLSEIKRAIPDCSKKVLIDTLRDLEALGLMHREDLSGRLRRVEYQIKPQYSERLDGLLQRLMEEGLASVDSKPIPQSK